MAAEIIAMSSRSSPPPDVRPRGLAAIRSRLAGLDPDECSGAVPGFIPPGLSVLYGPSGAKKSFAAIGLALRVAAGLPIGPFATRGGLAVYVAGEDRRGVEERAIAAAAALGIGDAAAFVVIDPPAPANDLKFGRRLGEALDALAAEFGPVSLVVVDTLGSVIAGASLNDDMPMTAATGALLAAVEPWAASALVIHHTGKRGDQERGSQVLRDRADAAIFLEGREGGSLAEIVKLRNGRAGRKFALTFARASFEASARLTVESLFLDGVAEVGAAGAASALTPPRDRANDRDEHVFAAISDLAGEGTISRPELLAHLRERGVLTGNAHASRMAFNRTVARLEAARRIDTSGEVIKLAGR